MGKAMRGDFIGFTFNGVHSSTLGIIRTSDGSRYSEDLLPTFQDKIVDAPNADETYFFGSFYKQKIINIPIAFDGLNESQIRKLKILLSDKGLHELWFDETPYKAYTVKANGSPTLKYVCFDDDSGAEYPTRIYKGEGTLSFIAYYPFAHSRYKYLNEYNTRYSNVLEWAPTSRLRIKGKLDQVLTSDKGRKIFLWNAGDLPTDFKINIKFLSNGRITSGNISLNENILSFSEFSKQGDDTGIQINAKLKLIQGFKEENGKIQVTSNIYNKNISSGDFFKIPCEDSILNIQGLKGNSFDIEYQYWYL